MSEERRTAEPAMFGTLLASRPVRGGTRTIRSTIAALVLHAGLVAGLVWATMAVGSEVAAEEEITFIEIPPEAPPPPPPPAPPEPTVQPPAIEAPLPVAPGFQTLTMPDIVPPDIPPPVAGVMIREADFSGHGTEGGRADGKKGGSPIDDVSVAPTFTPFTVRPELRNKEEVARALERDYPAILRNAGIGGTTIMWFLIDEAGRVVKTQVFESSGYESLDEAAAKVASMMRFSPALNRDKTVQVWVQIPIKFDSK